MVEDLSGGRFGKWFERRVDALMIALREEDEEKAARILARVVRRCHSDVAVRLHSVALARVANERSEPGPSVG